VASEKVTFFWAYRLTALSITVTLYLSNRKRTIQRKEEESKRTYDYNGFL